MLRVINNRRYDSDTARKVGENDKEELFRKVNGEFFFHILDPEDVVPLTNEQAKDWMSKNMDKEEISKVLTISDEKIKKQYTLKRRNIEKIKQYASHMEMSLSDALDQLIETYL